MTKWDPIVRGLHVIQHSDGSSYYLYYRTKLGKQRRSKLGDCGILSRLQARERARIILAEVALGGDPFGDMRIAKGERTIGDTYLELVEEHYSKARFQESRWAKEADYNWVNHLEKAFAGRKLSAVRAPDVLEWHAKFEASPVAGNRSKSVLSKIFSFAESRGYLPPGTNPCRVVPNHPERERVRFASSEEMEKLGKILARDFEKHPREVLFIYFLIFTGARPSIVPRGTWEDLEVMRQESEDYGVLKVRGKNGTDLMIIPPALLTLLKRHKSPLNHSLVGLNRFPREYWKRVRDEAGCPDLWARDWRRTFGTVGLSEGIGLEQVGELLNHRDVRSTRRYAKLLHDSRLRMSLKINSELLARLDVSGL